MQELIKITKKDGNDVVSARELYEYLGFDVSQWARWYRRNILLNDFAFELVDYQQLDIVSNGNTTKDFAITIDFAKKISMMARTEKGEEARNYFIEMEKKAKKPLSQIELIIQSAQLLQEIEQNQNQLEQRITEIENKPQINAPVEHFSILGYCHNIGLQIDLNKAKSFGQKCAKLCNGLGFTMGKIPDPRFGSVKTYPLDVLEQIIGKNG